MSAREHHVAGQAPNWRMPKIPAASPKPRAWDYPLTWIVLIALGMAAGFVFTLAVAGWLA